MLHELHLFKCWYRSKKVQQNDPHHLQKHNILVSIFLMTRPKYFWSLKSLQIYPYVLRIKILTRKNYHFLHGWFGWKKIEANILSSLAHTDEMMRLTWKMILRVKNDKKKLFSLKSDQILPISVYEVDSRLMN